MTSSSIRFSKRFFLVCLFCFAPQVFVHAATPIDLDNLAEKLAPEINKSGVKSIAVLDFVSTDGTPTDLG